jgi:enoyl-CoA hydratase/carnithine racemase
MSRDTPRGAPLSGSITIVSKAPTLELTLDRPDKKNALTGSMYAALAAALSNAEQDPSIRLVLFSGAGGCFTAGNDLTDFLHASEAGKLEPIVNFMTALTQSTKVLIAAVDGLAVGIGVTMLLHCDLVVASRSARFSLPFVNLGLVPELGSSMLFPALVGQRIASKHLLLAEPFDAETAFDYGLVSHLAESESALVQARQLAIAICAKSPEAISATRRLLRSPPEPLAERIRRELVEFEYRLQSAETQEAIAAVLARRSPNFSKATGSSE